MISLYISIFLAGAMTAAIAVHLWWEHRFEDAVTERLTRIRPYLTPNRTEENR